MKSQRRSTFVSTFASSLILVGSPMVAAFAQDPVTKPVNPPAGTGNRLPAPRNISAVQLPDGRIRVTWSPVAGATSYALVRSVPPDAAKPITPNATDTVFFDSDIAAGKTYYYLISGLNDAATGLRAGAAPVKAIRGVGPVGDVIPPTNVVARYDPIGKLVNLTWEGPPQANFLVETRRLSPESPWLQYMASSLRSLNLSGAYPAGTRVQFRVITTDYFGRRSTPTVSNEVLIDSSGVAPASSGGTTSIAATGTVAVTMGSALSLRVGATLSAGSALSGASASRWISLDEGIATVDAAGTVTGRAAGRAQILAIGRGADGAVRVTLVQATVSP